MELIEGKLYRVSHRRKGVFKLMVTGQDETWVTGIITSGKAGALLKYNEACPGEEITVRKCFCTFSSVK